jgi:hypothetical protein
VASVRVELAPSMALLLTVAGEVLALALAAEAK